MVNSEILYQALDSAPGEYIATKSLLKVHKDKIPPCSSTRNLFTHLIKCLSGLNSTAASDKCAGS